MFKNIHFILFVLCFFAFKTAKSQDSTSIGTQYVDSVEVKGEKSFDFYQSTKTQLSKPENSANKLISDVLFKKSNIYIKEYGNGQLASISVNGFSANHTDINWNGIKLNSPMLGQTDLNILSIGNSNSLSISNNNSDNLSGNLNLSHQVSFKKKNQLNLGANIGSFVSSGGNLSYTFANKRWYSNTLFSYQAARNNFFYRNPSLAGNPKFRQDNAETNLFNFENVWAYKLNSRNKVVVFAKYYRTNRNIAPSLYETSSTENQKDQLGLGKISWHHKYLNLETDLNTSFVYQEIDYRFSESSSSSKSIGKSWQSNFKMKAVFIDNFRYEGILSHEYETGQSSNYTEMKTRNRFKLDNSVVYEEGNFVSSIGFAQLLVDGELSPFLPKAKLQFTLKNLPSTVIFGTKYSAKVRYPTLNDLYWSPGGNEDLKPETSHNFNLSIDLDRKMKKVSIHNKFEVFAIFANNYIQWRPTSNSYWQPENIGFIFSRGFNNTLNLDFKLKKSIALNFELDYNFTRIGSLKSAEQLIYVPYYQINFNSGFKSKWINFGFNQHYTGERFAVSVNSKTMKAFYLLDFTAYKEFKFIKKTEMTVGVNLNNITNQTYYTVLNRPVPGFNFNFSLKYRLDFSK